jgi:hypothetical protein
MAEAVGEDGRRVALIGIVRITADASCAMAEELRMLLAGLLRKAQMEEEANLLRDGPKVISHVLMALEANQHLGLRGTGETRIGRDSPHGYLEWTQEQRTGQGRSRQSRRG